MPLTLVATMNNCGHGRIISQTGRVCTVTWCATGEPCQRIAASRQLAQAS
jgi:hypothetical protein